MKNIKTATEFIKWMWKNGEFEREQSLWDIENFAHNKGYTFNKPALTMALKRSDFIVKIGKLSNKVPLFRQRFPSKAGEEKKVPNHIQVFESLHLHPKIKEVSEGLFRDGYYAEAISNSCIKLIQWVKEKSGIVDRDGTDLMHYVFNEKKPVLKFNELSSQIDFDEQSGLRFMFAGTVSAVRNPKAHSIIKQKDPWKTLEYLSLTSLLMKRLDESKKS